MEAVLRTGIPADKLTLTYGADDGDGRPVSIEAAIKDAAAAYKQLYAKGLITKTGKEQPAEVRVSPEYKEFTAKMRWLYDPEYKEFTAKMRWLYDAIGATMDASVSYPWVTYWYTGMTPDEVYNLAYESHSFYGNPALTKYTIWPMKATASMVIPIKARRGAKANMSAPSITRAKPAMYPYRTNSASPSLRK